MDGPERFAQLGDYAFPRLRKLLDAHAPGGEPVNMTIGEPRHGVPGFVAPILAAHTAGFGQYPPNDGTPELQAAFAAWVQRRYGVAVGVERLLPLNGTREGLFNAAVALCPERKNGQRPVVLMPNPFYQVYAVAALTVGAEPVYVPAVAANGFLPDFGALPADVLDRTAILYICSPANPQGSVASAAYWANLLALAERHDFIVFADECYSEIWHSAPPPGILAAAQGHDPERVVAFHSLSKRSNLPGLRSGFAVAGPVATARMRQLRAFAGAPLPLPLQRVAEAAWADEAHVDESRSLYQAKFADAAQVFAGLQGFALPAGGFFLWLPVPETLADGEAAALKLWRETGVRVLPGQYLAREAAGGNPGRGYIRVALVGGREETRTGLTRLRDCLFG
jgi:aspartate/methionine/tyrosine aminotransferase